MDKGIKIQVKFHIRNRPFHELPQALSLQFMEHGSGIIAWVIPEHFSHTIHNEAAWSKLASVNSELVFYNENFMLMHMYVYFVQVIKSACTKCKLIETYQLTLVETQKPVLTFNKQGTFSIDILNNNSHLRLTYHFVDLRRLLSAIWCVHKMDWHERV